MAAKLKPVVSLNDLRARASVNPKYMDLMLCAARNLGGSPKNSTEAYNVLCMNANETDEEGVVAEVNYCRDLVTA